MRETLKVLGREGAVECRAVPANDSISKGSGGSLHEGECHMVPKRRMSARRALLDGNFARRELPLREREYCIWDTELAGFGLRVRPSGNYFWFVRLRHRGKHRRITLGRTDELEAGLARAQARRILAEAALDGLPKRGVVKATPTMTDFVEAYLSEHSNPFRGIKRNKGRKIERFLSEDEMARLGQALADAREEKPLEVAVISLLALTGCRRGEFLNLKWGEVQGRKLKLTNSKTGPRIVWLGEQARSVLDRFTRGPKHTRVLPFKVQPASAVDWFWRGLRRKAGLDDVRLHDLRHNYASLAARSSETLPMLANLLGHKAIDTTARYAHLDDAHIITAVDAVGSELERQLFAG